MPKRTQVQVEAEISKVRDNLKSLENELSALKKKTLVRCQVHNDHIGSACGRALEIGTLVYIQTLWYTQPHGCTDGDYWNLGEGQFVCPHCGHVNRLYDRTEIQDNRHLFLGIVSCHENDYSNKIVDEKDRQRYNELMETSKKLNHVSG